MLTTPASFGGGRLGDLGLLLALRVGRLARGERRHRQLILRAWTEQQRVVRLRNRRVFSPLCCCSLPRPQLRAVRARISSCTGPASDSERSPPRRSRPCTCLPSTTSAWCSSAGVRDLFLASTRDRPSLLPRLQSGVLSADRRPNGPHRVRRAAESSSRFITAAPAAGPG